MATKKDMTFEQAMKKLETIVHKLEDESLDLEETMKGYEEGIQLSKYCYEQLSQAKQKLEKMETEG